MADRKRKGQRQNTFQVALDFAELVDALFERYTGKTLGALLREPAPRPREIPRAKEAVVQEAPMPLADAYAILGLKPDAPLEEVKQHYRNLANLFHPDKGGYKEAMILLNRAYDQIMKERQRGKR